MLERGDVLLTWQLPAEPIDAESLPMPARRIGDHRTAYLTYEGPISGNRGHVRRIDSGTVGFEEIAADRIAMTLRESRLAGRFVLTRERDEEWVLGFSGSE